MLSLVVELDDFDVWLSDFERDVTEIGLGEFRFYRDSDERCVVEVFIDVPGAPAAQKLIAQQEWRTHLRGSGILALRVGGTFRRAG